MTAEEQITGEAEHGGLQIIVYPMKPERYLEIGQHGEKTELFACYDMPAPGMGLAPGGRMRQQLYDDPYGLDAWDLRNASRCFVSIANSKAWAAITRERPPTMPRTAEDYIRAGLPWFDYYDDAAKPLDGASRLKKLRSISDFQKAKDRSPAPNVSPGMPAHITGLGPKHADGRTVREVRF